MTRTLLSLVLCMGTLAMPATAAERAEHIASRTVLVGAPGAPGE